MTFHILYYFRHLLLPLQPLAMSINLWCKTSDWRNNPITIFIWCFSPHFYCWQSISLLLTNTFFLAFTTGVHSNYLISLFYYYYILSFFSKACLIYTGQSCNLFYLFQFRNSDFSFNFRSLNHPTTIRSFKHVYKLLARKVLRP